MCDDQVYDQRMTDAPEQPIQPPVQQYAPQQPGYPQQPQQVFVTYQKNSTNGVALAAVILGAIGAGLSLIPLVGPFLCWAPAILGIIFGFVGLSNAKKLNGLRKNLALWGVILGFAPIPISIIWLIIGAIGAAVTGGYSTTN